MVSVKPFEIKELNFLKDTLYESIYIPQNKPSKESLLRMPDIKKYYEDWGREGDYAYIALDKNSNPAGAVWCRLFKEDLKGYGYINDDIPELGIAVSKDSRGKGIGTKLMKTILKKAKEEGYSGLSLSVDPENDSAVRLYRKLGFENSGVSGTSITMLHRFEH